MSRSRQPSATKPDRLAEHKAACSEAIVSCINTALRVQELATRGQGEQVLEQANKLISLELTFVSTANTAQQRLTRAAGAYASSQEALGRPVGRLLAASGRLEALLAVEESARNQAREEQQQQRNSER